MPLLTNTGNKCVIIKLNLFLTSFLIKMFPPKVYHFQYDDRLFFSTEMGHIRTCKEVCLEKL